jgi:predicted acetyltransferase
MHRARHAQRPEGSCVGRRGPARLTRAEAPAYPTAMGTDAGQLEVETLDVGYARPGDVRAVAGLWCRAFPSRRSVDERVRMLESGGRYGGLETTLVARLGGRMVGACKIYRLTQYIGGVAMPAMGLAAVAVEPGARRRGVGAGMCTRAMELSRARGDALATLYPFRPDYYGRLGWGLVGELHDYRFDTAALPSSDGARHVRAARMPADGDGVAACYARVAAASNGPIQRDRRAWEYRLAGEELGVRPPGVAGPRDRVIVYDRGGILGYAMLRAVRRPAGPALHIRELVAETEAAYRGILGAIATRSQRWPVARHTARVEEGFGDRLSDPRPPGAGSARTLYFPTARIIRGPMLRVLDAPRALALRRYFEASPDHGRKEMTLDVTVRDSQVPGNHGPWRIHIGAGKAALETSPPQGEGHRTAGQVDARLETDAPTLARIFAGDLAPSRAAALGSAKTEGDASLLDAAFATRHRFWLLDEF